MPAPKSVPVRLLGAAASAAGVFASAQLTIQLPVFGSNVFPVWFPAGAMLYCIGRFGWAGAAGCAVGSFLFNWQISPWWVAAGVAGGAALSYRLGAVALARSGFRGAVGDLDQTRRFLLFGVLLAPLLSAVNGPLWLIAGGQIAAEDGWRAALLWWAGDAVGVIALAPALYLFLAPPVAGVWKIRSVEANAAAAFAVLAVAGLVFLPGSRVADARLPLVFLPVLAVSVLSYLMRSPAAALGLFLTAAVGVVGTSFQTGPFAGYDPRTGAVLLALFTATLGVVTLMVLGVRGNQARLGQALAAAAREYQLLVDGSPTLICRYRADGRVTFVNDTLRAFAGDAASGHDLGLPTGPTGEGEVECRAADGSRRWVRWTAREVGPDADGVTEFQAVGVDVTDRRRAEEERRAIEQQMFQTAKLESLGVIAGGVAHDFNNILTGILGNVELAGGELPAGSPALAYLAKAAEAAARAADLNRQLLAYAGKGRFLIRPVDLNELAELTVELVRLSLPKKVAVRLDRRPRLPPVRGDESQFQQVLMNLLINAGDAIGEDAGAITVRTGVADAQPPDPANGTAARPGRYVTLEVSDTGCGMDDGTREKIFEPFFTTKFTGRGLGLAAVQGIVRGHKGALTLATAPGAGTTFTVYLPEYEPEPASATDGSVADALAPERLAPHPNARRNAILVVDDEDAVRELTATILRHIGWKVLTACNGREGVDVFRQNADRIACAILDLTMPVMDGLEAMAELRGLRPRLPVLICTGYAEESIPPSATNAPTGVLLKPFRPDDLQQALGDLFEATTGGTSPLP